MWSELVERVWSECPLHLRDMGYLNEMLGIRDRWRSFKTAWEPHCQRSRQLVLAAAERCGRRRRAVVIGSGWLHDVPLAELAERFEEVLLVDLFHPQGVRWQASRYKNVRLQAADITGTLEAVWRAAEVPGSPLPQSAPGLLVDADPADLTVSLNILSQLPCKPERYLRQRGHHSASAIAAYCHNLIVAHLDYLRQLPGVVCLIADCEILTFDSTGKLLRSEPTLYGIDFPYQGEEWIWPLVPRQTHYPHHTQHLRVIGVIDIHDSRG